MGNAVSPCVASALGRCLALAAIGAAAGTLESAVVPVPDPALLKVLHFCFFFLCCKCLLWSHSSLVCSQ